MWSRFFKGFSRHACKRLPKGYPFVNPFENTSSCKLEDVSVSGRFPWKAVAIGGAAALGVAAIVWPERNQWSKKRPRVALFGDSYAQGLAPWMKTTGAFSAFEGDGIVGLNTWQAKIPAWLPEFQPEVVLVSLGVNDGNSPNVANCQRIIQTLHGMGAKVVWIQPPVSVNTPAHVMIDSLGVPTVPALVLPMADRLHPTRQGYGTWASSVTEVAQRVA